MEKVEADSKIKAVTIYISHQNVIKVYRQLNY